MSASGIRGDLGLLQTFLQDEWQEDNEYRDEPVPKPQIYIEGQEDVRSTNYASQDVIFILDGGTEQVEAASLAHRHEEIRSPYEIEMRTGQSRTRLEGDGSEVYGGIVGEVKRILDKYRNGIPGEGARDHLIVESFDDEVGNYGAQTWVARWNIELVHYAATVRQDPALGPGSN